MLQKTCVVGPHLSGEMQNVRELMGKHVDFHFHVLL